MMTHYTFEKKNVWKCEFSIGTCPRSGSITTLENPSQQNQIFSVISNDSKWFFKPLNIAEYSVIQSIVIIFGSKYLVFVFRLSLKTRKGYYTVYYVLFR